MTSSLILQSVTPSLGLIILIVTIFIEGLLAFLVFSSNRKSATNIIFLLLNISTMLWLFSAYIVRLPEFADRILLLQRLGIFFAAPMSMFFFLLAHTIPSNSILLNKKWFWITIGSTLLMMVLNISPYAFTNGTVINGNITPTPGPGLIPFAVISTVFSVLAVYSLIKKFRSSMKEERTQFRLVLAGIVIMLVLIIGTILIPILFFNSGQFVPFTPLYTLAFLGLTAYTIIKHHLFNLKVIATEALVVIIWLVLFSKILLAQSSTDQIVDGIILGVILIFGIFLIRSVRREVEQRERLQKLTEELSSANDKLKELDVQKNQFLSFASHDLKSPINIIKQFASLIADGTYKEPVKVAETIQKIKVTADRATHLVDDFLDIRKIEEGHMDYTFEVRDIVSFVKGVTDDYALIAKAEKNIAVSFESPVSSCNVKMDTTRLRQVIQNLLSNSLKYTEAGTIKVSLTEEQKSVLITVKDTGIGMDKQLLPILFEQFRRDPSVAKKIQGTGLGLYISKQIVIAHHGEIWAESEGKGFGSSFFVRLPKS